MNFIFKQNLEIEGLHWNWEINSNSTINAFHVKKTSLHDKKIHWKSFNNYLHSTYLSMHFLKGFQKCPF